MATKINSNEDMPGRESVVERLPSHYGLSNHQRSQSSIGTFNQSRPSSSAKVRTRNGVKFCHTPTQFLNFCKKIVPKDSQFHLQDVTFLLEINFPV